MGRVSPEKLALHGGISIRRTLLPYGRHEITEEDIAAVTAALRSDWITTGPRIEEFERAFAVRVGARHAVAFSSGTAALHGAAFAAGLGPGAEAITTPLTFCASANCLLYMGAKPVFVDVEPSTLGIDPARVEAALGPATRAIVAVDYAGQPADYQRLREIAAARGLVLIGDAAHALGAEWQGRPIGSVADLTAFSFHPVKHIATGEGGMVTTGDEGLATRLRMFRNHGITSEPRARQARGEWRTEMVELGYNYRLSDVACALGRSQLRRLDANLARRREIAARYREAFASLPALELPVERPEARSAWHIYPVRLVLERLRAGRDEVLAALRAENIGAAVHYGLVPDQPYYRRRFGTRGDEWPVARGASERLLTLPLFPSMTGADADDVIAAVSKVTGYYAL